MSESPRQKIKFTSTKVIALLVQKCLHMPEVQVERGESPCEKCATLVCGPKLGEKKEIPRMQDKRRDNAFRAKKKINWRACERRSA